MGYYGFGMAVKTTTITGFLKLWVLAKLKGWRPHSYRWQIEQANIEDWLELVNAAAALNAEFAIEVAELARLIKGYGSTYRRGLGCYTRIAEEYVRPILTSGVLPGDASEKLQRARKAATEDPDGAALNTVLAEISVPGTLAAE